MNLKFKIIRWLYIVVVVNYCNTDAFSQNWEPLGNGTDNAIRVLYADTINNSLYAGGHFTLAGGKTVNGIAVWDGYNWSGFTGGLNCYSGPATEYKEKLYVGANFDNSYSFDNIAWWDGVEWQSLDGGLYGNLSSVSAFAIYDNELYVGGYFFKSEGNPGNCIAKWDGNSWSDVGGGTNAAIYTLTVFNNELYAGGVFTMAGGIPAHLIAKWNGDEWCSLGSIFSNNEISDLAVWNDELYIAGSFKTIDGDSIDQIAKWTGGNYVDTCGVITSMDEKGMTTGGVSVYPNPGSDKLIIEFDRYNGENINISIFNVLGQGIYYDKDKIHNAGTFKKYIDVAGLASGIYFVRICHDEGVMIKKVVKN